MTIQVFLSYSRLADDHDNGAIFSLCENLEKEVTVQTGVYFTIIRDKRDIHWGEQWQQFVESASNSAHFLLPIITESYFRSVPCQTEYLTFRDREIANGRSNLILPVYYLDVSDPVQESDDSVRAWKEDILAREYFDWRELRHSNHRTKTYKSAITRMGTHIKRIIEAGHAQRDVQRLPAIPLPLVDSTSSPNSRDEAQVGSKVVRFLKATFRIGYAEQVEERYGRLSQTQKNIMRFIYVGMHRKEISVDEMFSLFGKAYENEVETKAELFYRLKDLDHLRLVYLKGAGYKTSSVLPLKSVQRAAIEKDIFKT